MRRFTSAPNPGVASPLVHPRETRGAGPVPSGRRRARSVPHPVVAGEVGAGLGGGDQVVRRDGVRGVRQMRVDDLGAGFPDRAQRRIERRTHLRVEARLARLEQLSRHADAQPSGVAARGVRKGGGRRAGRRRVERVRPGDDRQHRGRVSDGEREGADLIERRPEGKQAVAGDAPVGRLEADDAAERGRLAHRSPGVGSDRHRREPRRDRGRRPPLDPPGVRSGAHGLRVGP